MSWIRWTSDAAVVSVVVAPIAFEPGSSGKRQIDDNNTGLVCNVCVLINGVSWKQVLESNVGIYVFS